MTRALKITAPAALAPATAEPGVIRTTSRRGGATIAECDLPDLGPLGLGFTLEDLDVTPVPASSCPQCWLTGCARRCGSCPQKGQPIPRYKPSTPTT